MYETGLRFRQSSAEFYHINPHEPVIAPWTSGFVVLKVLQFFYTALVRALREQHESSGSTAAKLDHVPASELRTQLRQLASILLSVYTERHDHLKYLHE